MRNSNSNHSRPLPWIRAILVLLALVAGVLSLAEISSAVDLGLIQRIAATNSRGENQNTVAAWIRLLADARNLPESEKLKAVNDFVNRNIRFEDDQMLWGQSDYWATPLETLSAGAGDCEDFSIAKYFTLKAIGIPTSRLRLIYVRAQSGGPTSGMSQAHMVLAYYPSPDSQPLVLDNLISEIRPASRRADLSPIFSFNSDGIWAGTGAGETSHETSRLSRWRDLLTRARSEGFD
ncbi:MAG: transglutaminase-like cysteine peptidase [Sterolibacteriaceae bacterium]|uniref:Transglutaminase-like cysteine peptidase n=1 Tax=Candidatus Methylophosphatis roskildensis TaxID=2899263 RepID=A0A9D7E5Y3_9PROT|nr:transglutaminase-like cysteine peptidase [Candidatus Methylophosphatis roskildensis]MBK7238091.1 transglutaminase-like cysteine peptidase [Sterolibacteriaceae bacterium]